jgi:hypothetical protein
MRKIFPTFSFGDLIAISRSDYSTCNKLDLTPLDKTTTATFLLKIGF